MKNLTANLENSQRLAVVAKEKGVELPESYFVWDEIWGADKVESYELNHGSMYADKRGATPAYTAGELGEMFPNDCDYHSGKNWGEDTFGCNIHRGRDWCFREEAPTEADARCLMLIHLLEEGLTKRLWKQKHLKHFSITE